MTHIIKHEGLGIEFEIPEITQRVLEDWARTQRLMRHDASSSLDIVIETATDAVLGALRKTVKDNLRINSPAAAGAAEIAARTVLRIGAEYTSNTEISTFETGGFSVRAAAKLGWLAGVSPDEVDDWLPAKVAWLATEINKIVIAAHEIPPN